MICTSTTIRTSLANTLYFVEYYKRMGIDLVILYFDDPRDPSLEALAGREGVLAIACDEAYWASNGGLEAASTTQKKQWVNITNTLHYARRHKIDWIVHVDADELLYGESLTAVEELQAIDQTVDVVLFPTVEAAPQSLHYENPFEGISLFKVGPSPDYSYLRRFKTGLKGRLKGRYERYQWNKRYQQAVERGLLRNHPISAYIHGHTLGKSAFRSRIPLDEITFVHLPLTGGLRGATLDMRLSISEHVVLLHYDCLGYHEWFTKWKRRLDGDTLIKGAARRDQLQALFEEALNAGQTEALYEALYMYNEANRKALLELGLLREIQVAVA